MQDHADGRSGAHRASAVLQDLHLRQDPPPGRLRGPELLLRAWGVQPWQLRVPAGVGRL